MIMIYKMHLEIIVMVLEINTGFRASFGNGIDVLKFGLHDGADFIISHYSNLLLVIILLLGHLIFCSWFDFFNQF